MLEGGGQVWGVSVLSIRRQNRIFSAPLLCKKRKFSSQFVLQFYQNCRHCHRALDLHKEKNILYDIMLVLPIVS